MTEAGTAGTPPPANADRLFLGSCVALIATSVTFAVVGAVMVTLKQEFVLSNQQVGWIGGASLWGFAVSQLIFAPLCDSLGMRLLARLAFVCHLVGVIIMITASGFTMLFVGGLVIAMGNGLVEAACNPLVATLYPDNKTVKLNQFHVWFPGGIVLGGLGAFALSSAGIDSWQITVGLVLIPTIAYGFLILGQEFPETEGVQSGVSMGEMFKATFATPLMWVMLVAMAMTASVELGPNRWVPAVLEAGGMAGILVLVWINGLMAIMRFRAGPFVKRFSPTGILLISAILSGVGLYWLSYASSLGMALASATVFALGVCYFWPTMLGFVSERVPRSGALGLGLMGAMGMAVVGLVTAPQMGKVADQYAHEQLPVTETLSTLQGAVAALPRAIFNAEESLKSDFQTALDAATSVVAHRASTGALPPIETANALRALGSSGADIPEVAEANALLGPADNFGGKVSFRFVVPLCGILLLIFATLYMQDKKSGGYRVQSIQTA
jgi:fucose permease